jgi:hypothetical protein
MFTNKEVSAIYLYDEEIRNLKHDLNKLVAKSKIQSSRDLIMEYRSIADLQLVLQQLTYAPEES